MHSPAPSPDSPKSGNRHAGRERLQESLSKLWTTSQPAIRERLETLRRAQSLLENDALDQRTISQAQDAAHKLAGILGTFGLPLGTDLARQLEVSLEKASDPGMVDVRATALSLDELTDLIERGPTVEH